MPLFAAQRAGSLRYFVTRGRRPAGTLRIFQAWESSEAVAAHLTTPHTDRFRSRGGGLGVREFTLRRYQIDPGAPTRA